MRRWTAVLLVGSIGACAAGAARAQALQRAIEAAEALGARTGVAVCSSDGTVLFRARATEGFAPASNMKLLTAVSVIDGLGAEFRFTTRFALRGGRLVVTASGDPNWIHDTTSDPALVFGAVARALQRLGVKAIAGIDLDAGTFTGPARPATWPQDQLQTYYCAPTGPFVLEQGTFALRLESRSGDNAAVTIAAPAVDAPVRGAIELVDKAKNATYGAIDEAGAVLVRGHFPRKGGAVTIRTAVADPAWWYRQALAKALAEAGIAVADAASPALPALPALADQVVHEHTSELRQALLRMLEDSSNFDAEQCLRVLGAHVRRDGSLAGGVAALQDAVQKLVGAMPSEATFVDGSGLSKQNRVTPGLLVVALLRAHGQPAGALLRACLPVAGQSGTLAERFTGSDLVGRVRAKTGWIRGASALSGLVERRDGSVRYFSILMNYDAKKDGLNKDLKRVQEDIVRAIDSSESLR
jgi:D-alanyl-D-alanine carboxypeptidase/D-alanyl-D-alanine-endopeptidase (penicillin-binding protein 4)